MKSRIMPVIAALLLTMAATAHAQSQSGVLRGDFNGDGRLETVRVSDNGQSGTSLSIESPGRASVRAPEIAWSLEPATLERAANGSLLLKTSHIGIGRTPHEQTLTIAWRRGAWRVVGITRSTWDRIDPDGALTCDINFLTGRGTAMRPGEPAARPVRVNQRAPAITEWSWERDTPSLCTGE